jgi:uncharacterized delta-60 repeat protein
MKKHDSIQSLILLGSLLLQLSTLCFLSRGAAGDVDLSFDAGSVVTNPAAMVLQPDGKVLVGYIGTSALTFINGTNRYASARLNIDGSLDSSFLAATNFNPDLLAVTRHEDCLSSVYTCIPTAYPIVVAVQADGKVIVGGYVQTEVTGEDVLDTYYHAILGRFYADGSADTNFTPVFGRPLDNSFTPEAVTALVVQPDGKILVGGAFGFVDGTNRYGIARLNTNGSLDHTFNAAVPNNPLPSIYSVALQSDDKVLIGGTFTYGNFTNRNNVARLNADGSLDVSFNPGAGVDGNGPGSIAVQSDGKVLIGGNFTAVNGADRNRIARLNANGSLDSSFNAGTGANDFVRSIALQPDGNVLIGGGFLAINGVLRPYMARLIGDSPWPSLSITRSNAFVIVSWITNNAGYQLQERTNVSLTNSWSSTTQSTVTNAGRISATIPLTAGNKFFRLN